MSMLRKMSLQVDELACIGLQAMASQKARKVWIDARNKQRALLRGWYVEHDNEYLGEPHGEGDSDIDEAGSDRRKSAAESVKQARKLRAMVNRYAAKYEPAASEQTDDLQEVAK